VLVSGYRRCRITLRHDYIVAKTIGFAPMWISVRFNVVCLADELRSFVYDDGYDPCLFGYNIGLDYRYLFYLLAFGWSQPFHQYLMSTRHHLVCARKRLRILVLDEWCNRSTEYSILEPSRFSLGVAVKPLDAEAERIQSISRHACLLGGFRDDHSVYDD